MPTVDVCIGSRYIPATTVNVVANAVGTGLAFPAGYYYLTHGTASLSLLDAFVTMLETHAEITTGTAIITRSGRTRIAADLSTQITSWGSDTTLRDALGFAGTLALAAAHVTTTPSPMFWSPGKTVSTEARLGSDGIRVKDTMANRSAPGSVVATTNNEWRENVLRWRFILADRYEQVPAANNTYDVFWNQVLEPRRRFYVGLGVTEDTADTTTDMAISTRIPAALPYVWRNEDQSRRDHQREIETIEVYGRAEIPVETASEYT